MTNEFDLASLIRELRDDTGEFDPKLLWPKVLDALSPADYRAALALTLPNFVRLVLSRSSSRANETEPEPASASSISGSTSIDNTTSTTSVPGTSWRDTAAEEFKESVCVDGARWVALGDCTVELLREAVVYKRLIASRTLTAATHYERLADALESSGHTYVHELDVVDVKRILRGNDEE